MADSAPIVVTLGFDPTTFARLDALRSRYFPPERNVVPAHLSLFHHLPAEDWAAMDATLGRTASAAPAIAVSFSGILKLGSGMAISVEAPGLRAIHDGLSRAFGPWLTPQDRQKLRPHVTIMNKADPLSASLALAEFRGSFEPWSGLADAILAWRYRGGPWEPLARYDFSGPVPP